MSATLYQAGDAISGRSSVYRIVRFLGRGGFGETFHAKSAAGVDVTIKVMLGNMLESFKALQLFEREAQALSRLDHPRLPKLIEVFVSDGTAARPLAEGEAMSTALASGARVVLAQTFIPGRSLQAALDEWVPLDGARAEKLARELLEILSYLHAQDPPIIHRDIKPSNIIIDDHGDAHLIDFGAIQRHAGGSTMIGTWGYFPPEQLLGRASPASDLYSLGMTLAVALTGKPPEQQQSDTARGELIVPENLPPRMHGFIAALTKIAPARRPQTAAAALRVLDEQPTVAAAGKASKAVFSFSLLLGTIAPILIYFVFFNRLSQDRLLQLAPLWWAPFSFGVVGRLSWPHRHCVRHAVIGTLCSLGMLLLILAATF